MKLGAWGQVAEITFKLMEEYRNELRYSLAEKALSGATLSKRDRWHIAELLTGNKYPAPQKRGGQSTADNDVRLFLELCDIAAQLENVAPGKLKNEALKVLEEREANQRGRENIDESTIRKAVERGASEFDFRQLQKEFESKWNPGIE